MKTLKVLLQEVVSGIKAWVNSNFAQESNAVHKTGNETINGVKTFTGNVFQNQAGGTNVYCATCDGAVKGDLTSSGTFSIVCKDGSNANMETSGLAAVYMGQDTSGSYVALRADTSYNNTRYNASVSLDIDPTTANNNAVFRPRRDNTIDLGSSSYQFKNTYTKGLYVDGNQVDPTMFPFMLATTTNGGLFPYCKLGYDDYVGKGFNDLTDTGMYRARTDSTVPNTPDAGTIDGILVVFNAGSAANVSNNRRCRQIYYTFNTNLRTFTRVGSLSSTTGNWTWHDWVEIPTNNRSYTWNGTQYFLGSYLGNEYTSNYYTNFGIYGKRDTYGQSGMFITKYRSAVNQGEMATSDVVQLGIDALENSVRTHNVLDIKAKGYDSETGKFTVCDVVTALEGNLGTTDRPWKTINGLNPGSLSLPGARITLDTTGWDNTGTNFNEYTPTADGWILLTSKDVVGNLLFATWKDDTPRAYAIGTGTFSDLSAGLVVMIPVIKSKTIMCLVKSNNYNARFFPCLGNV